MDGIRYIDEHLEPDNLNVCVWRERGGLPCEGELTSFVLAVYVI